MTHNLSWILRVPLQDLEDGIGLSDVEQEPAAPSQDVSQYKLSQGTTIGEAKWTPRPFLLFVMRQASHDNVRNNQSV